MAFENYLNVLNKKHANFEEFVGDLDNILHKTNETFQSSNNIGDYVELINQLKEIREAFGDVCILIKENRETNIGNIIVKCTDIMGKYQHVTLQVDENKKVVIKDHSLPNNVDFSSTYKDMVSAIGDFKDKLALLSDYFENMADLDASCWIVDPVNPTSKDNFRRIVIGENVSIVVTIDCYKGQDIPYINVLGPSALVDPICQKVHQYYEQWDTDLALSFNLLNMLGLSDFPTKPTKDNLTESMETDEIECGICLSSRDSSGVLPNIVCEKKLCGLNYHNGCLYQWLSAVPSNIQTFNTIHGECPNCSTSISCSV